MIEYKRGDILQEDAEALVNTVNCVGVMGRGIALQFKKAFPKNFKAYSKACKSGEVKPGKMFVFDTESIFKPRYIINFPTKRHWRGKSKMADIETGLGALAEAIREYNIKSVAIPPLGCGLGGLDWVQVKAKIEEKLNSVEGLQVIAFEPKGAPAAEKMVRNRKAPKMTPGRAVLLKLMDCYLAGLLDPFVSLLEVHKLMYFMQEAGEPLKLQFQKAYYGPYAENLRHVLSAIEGHFVTGYADGGDNPGKELNLVSKAVDEASRFLESHPATLNRFKSVTRLVDGFESPFGLELLSTVHWVIQKENATSRDEVISRTYAWDNRKRRFTPRQICLAVDLLKEQDWIDAGLPENSDAPSLS